MPFAVKMGLGGTGYMGKKESYLRSARKRKSRRVVADGFPIREKFKSIEDVRKYLSGDRITCLICGRQLKRLGNHLMPIHGIDENKYRETYGIPWTYGLAADATSKKYAKAVKHRLETIDGYKEKLLLQAEKARVKIDGSQRRSCDAVLNLNTETISKATRQNTYDRNSYEEFLNRLKLHRTPVEVSSDDDMPSLSHWWLYRRNNPEYHKRFIDMWDALPFEVQARGQRLGVRFERELKQCFDAGMSDHLAAEKLGVTAMTCNYITREWRAAT